MICCKIGLLLQSGLIILAVFLCLGEAFFYWMKRRRGGKKTVHIYLSLISCVMVLLNGWGTVYGSLHRRKKEIVEDWQKEEGFHDLLLNIRLRQHEFQNHIDAILSARYVYKTYEELVEAQAEYWEKLSSETGLSRLLMIKEPQLAGFLYRKILELEGRGVVVRYRIASGMEYSAVPLHKRVEMLGNLLDNAGEAMDEIEGEKQINISLEEEKEFYRFMVSNPCRFVTMEEIVSWFSLKNSSKGRERGLGLYHLQQLCEKYDGRIYAECLEVQEGYRIQFVLDIRKDHGRL